MDTDEAPLMGGCTLLLWSLAEGLVHLEEVQIRAINPSHLKVPVLRWFENLIRMPNGCLPLEVFQARPTERRPWGVQGLLEGLYIPPGWGTPWDPLGEAGKCCWGEGHGAAANMTQSLIGIIKQMDGCWGIVATWDLLTTDTRGLDNLKSNFCDHKCWNFSHL